MHAGSPQRGSPARRGTPSRRGSSRPLSETPRLAQPPAEFSGQSPATFITCLDIAVEGAIPIEKLDSAAATSQKDASRPPVSESKRAPRKSKTDAIAALTAATQEETTHAPHEDVGTRILLRDGLPIPVLPLLDLSSVKTPSNVAPSRPKERPFGLTDCPTFRPTPEQFKDPMAYIKSISENAKSYGMCKIIPPLGWSMPFVTDTENFRFKTRLQRLNSIEASSRAKVNFLEQLYRFHKQQGNPRVSVPTINHKALDLWLLRKEVQRLGGYEQVTKNKKWADLGRVLGYGGIPGLATQIKNSYARVILPYEHFCDHVRNSPNLSPSKQHDPHLKTHGHFQTLGKSNRSSVDVDDTPPSSPLSTSSSPLSEPPDESESRLRRSTRQSSDQPTPLRRRANQGEGLDGAERQSPAEVRRSGSSIAEWALNTSKPHCEVCLKKDRGEEMLLCDGCDCGFHTFCLDPPLEIIPRGQWFCHNCLFGTGGDFGFDEGQEHSLSSFQARDAEFRKLWFTMHPPSDSDNDRERIYDGEAPFRSNAPDPAINKYGDVIVSETDVEREFWRLVQSPNETVEVEYGADVHSTTHGSAMPNLESHPLSSYSKDPWNLNNIPVLTESLLRFITSDISGMTVPWTYVGMVFSTFCWHNEDHYTYSINYMHWGETKTWYSIPGEDAEKFEAAIRREAPDLFEAQPDLLFQLVTLMNPQRLKEAGVDVYACNQRAGEFVITFPKAYHAGFNHGFNFNEAVNFALPDWLPQGLECVRRYQEHRKHPVFSHDELIITITQHSQSIRTAIWLNDSLQEMVERELKARQRIRAMDMGELPDEAERSEEQAQCKICNCFCYLSQITCSCTPKVVCIDHVDELCSCPKTSQILHKRFSDSYLQDVQYTISERASVPTQWKDKFQKLLSESPRPHLRGLKTLLAEGDRIQYPLSGMHTLRKCVTRANEWLDAANTFLVRKPIRKKLPRRGRGRPLASDVQSVGIDDIIDKPDRSLADLYALLREVEDLGFDAPEIAQLKALSKDAEETKGQARQLLDSVATVRDRDAFVQECEKLMNHGLTLNVHVDELVEIEKIVMREQLLKEMEQDSHDQLTLEDIRRLISRAHSCSLGADNKHMKFLEDKLRLGTVWEDQAKAVLDKQQRTLAELEEAAKSGEGVPVDPALLETLINARQRGLEIEKQITTWLHPPDSTFPRPRVQDVVKLVSRGEKEFNIPVVQDMRRTVDFAVDLESRCEMVLKGRYTHTEETDIFQTMRQWKTYAKDHLSMFSLPNFERLDKQLTLHFRWVESLPWYCRSHQAAHAKPILDDVIDATRPEDDLAPSDEYYTCICPNPVRPPAPGTVSDAVQCDHCFARFHGVCAANGGSCPFCDHQHWNGSLHKERTWHFYYLPNILLTAPEITRNFSEDWKHLEIIVHRIDRLASAIGQFLAFVGQPPNQRPDYIPQVRHYMRKLYKIQFAVAQTPDSSYGLDLAGLHRILAGQPAPVRMKKRRRPKFMFGQDLDKDWVDGTRCICRGRTAYLLHYPTVECEHCQKKYHGGCVFFPIDPTPGGNNRFTCPLCCLRKNRAYPFSEVRVKHLENPDPSAYVDTKEMLETFSKDIIYVKLNPPYTQTLFVELARFTPGQPDSLVGPVTPLNGPSRTPQTPVMGSHPAYPTGPSHPPSGPSSAGPSASGQRPHSPTTPYDRSSGEGSHHVPPPPWSSRSRWSNAAATAPPPSATRNRSNEASSPPLEAAGPSRKRKHSDASPTAGSGENLSVSIPSPTAQPSPKRRSTVSTTPVTMHPPPQHHSPIIHAPPPMHPQIIHAPIMHAPHMPHPMAMPPQPVHAHPMHPAAISTMHVPHHLPIPIQAMPIQPIHSPIQPIHSPIQPVQSPPMQARGGQGMSSSLAMMLSPPGDARQQQQQQQQSPPQQPPPTGPPQPRPRGAAARTMQPHPQMMPAMDQRDMAQLPKIPQHPMGPRAFDRFTIAPPQSPPGSSRR